MARIDQWLNEARTLHQHGRMGEAAGLYRKILDVSPDHVEAIFSLATFHAQCGDTAAAMKRRAMRCSAWTSAATFSSWFT